MRTNLQTTYVLLERGIEDKQLVEEINKVIIDLKIRSTKEVVRRFPMLNELKQGLDREILMEEMNGLY